MPTKIDPKEQLDSYLHEVFGQQSEQLETLMERATAAGLPDIAVSPDVGNLLMLLASMTNEGRGAERIIEVGCLAGYSSLWLAQGLAQGGRLYTIEPESTHADFAQSEFDNSDLTSNITIVRESGLDALKALSDRLGPISVDVLFFDAIKTEYTAYLKIARPMLRVGGLLMADNALGSDWNITDDAGSNESRDAMDTFNRAVASDSDFQVACIANRQGLMVAKRVS